MPDPAWEHFALLASVACLAVCVGVSVWPSLSARRRRRYATQRPHVRPHPGPYDWERHDNVVEAAERFLRGLPADGPKESA